ncbi:MAG TPA: hypothetical protein VG672_05125 [Bryobacteraceae bacterium]|nr:hypothetical protein [Bryobacteraceae bacterium]
MGTLPAWPEFAIPFAPLNDPFAQTPGDSLLRSDFEQGMARQRRVFRSKTTTFDLQWAMTPEQYAVWKGFRGLVAGGQFTVPVFADADYVTVTAQFVAGSIKATRSGGEWIVAAQVETQDKLEPLEEDYVVTLLLWGYGGTLDDFMAAFHTAVHTGFYGALA